MQHVYDKILQACQLHIDSNKKKQMEAYMKNKFIFFGIPQPLRQLILKDIKNAHHFQWTADTKKLVNILWNSEQRELQYIAMDILKPLAKKLTLEDLDWVESLIVHKSWWDTVDLLATHLVGHILSNSENKESYAISRIENDNMWLNRTALLFQLKYKKETNWNLLQTLILMTESSNEFFIRKAQGWALREYSKTNPLEVRTFVENNPQLSGLTQREAMKYVNLKI